MSQIASLRFSEFLHGLGQKRSSTFPPKLFVSDLNERQLYCEQFEVRFVSTRPEAEIRPCSKGVIEPAASLGELP